MEFFAASPEVDATALLKDAIVVAPAISFANMGQLVVDVLVNSALGQVMDMQRVGYLFSKRVAPMAGAAAFATQAAGDLCLNMEVYLMSYPLPNSSAVQKVAFVQQRTSVLPGQSAAFVREFVAWTKLVQAASVLLLAGADNMLCHDRDMHVHRIKWAGANGPFFNDAFLAMIPRLPLADGDATVWDATRGTGLAPAMDREAASQHMNFLSFVLFCAEGNNVPDAVYLASCVAQYLQLPPASFKLQLPPSWSHLFGRDPSVSLFL
ncbi:hypothetical protein SPRG_08753 [Saprolegnia parasitica CBS 223.65]|uniref:Proteasome assembly chaperone 2 n=1 Tax=Saprolegnia parasitica (strain CBS 223.65) TaxID=695850 RepID=A0A067C9H1_SAPPC|nr:hypothetical protein SPRG_08753 [Saprolegnia parasitica CBS 223.65]KDO25810.1 hypothetical protein SPRG_08753 [Saprolegnia parasitica CBS 223.65]|eukprot:XP_012203375.1 hypothetical protein SPRG_08753 [Saprolegnia parasitica CBS 223.65]